MGVNGKISVGVFFISLLMVFVSIVCSMLEQSSIAAVIGMVASALCIPGLYVAFQSWEEEEEDFPEE